MDESSSPKGTLSPKAVSPSPSDWVLLASFNEDLLNKEHSLCHYRMTWTIASQTIFFAAYFAIVVNYEKIPNDIFNTLIIVIPLLALLIIVIEGIGIHGAVKMMHTFESERSKNIKRLNHIFDITMPDSGINRTEGIKHTRFFGIITYYVIPILIFFFWISILSARINPPTLKEIRPSPLPTGHSQGT